jgi:vacuolar protein-sorting-associated protein 4
MAAVGRTAPVPPLLSEALNLFKLAQSSEGAPATAVEFYRQVCIKANVVARAPGLGAQWVQSAQKVAAAAQARVKALQTQAAAPPAQRPSSARVPQRPPPAPAPAPADPALDLSSAILTERPDVKFADVAGLAAAKHLLNEAVIMPLRLPELYVGPTRPWAGILLYGPPGTGKSYLAKAVAGEATNTTFLTVSNADLTSKWVGESEKLVRELFETARRNRPSVVFIDEIDALVSARGGNESESGKRIKTEFLVQMDGVGSKNDGVVIIAATNLPWDLDQAMLRRFERRIYIPLPDVSARTVLIQGKLRDAHHSLEEKDISAIAKATEGYSGADLATLVRDALMAPIREFEQAEVFIKVSGKDLEGRERDGLWAPKRGLTYLWEEKRECRWDALPKEDLARPVAMLGHFKQSAKRLRPSVDRSFLARYDDWTKRLGEVGV